MNETELTAYVYRLHGRIDALERPEDLGPTVDELTQRNAWQAKKIGELAVDRDYIRAENKRLRGQIASMQIQLDNLRAGQPGRWVWHSDDRG